MYLRLRQIALVARALEPTERTLTSALQTEVSYRDPGVAKYGLHNALWALGGTFLEVVAPTRDDTAAGRYLDRRKGDGGYMVILDCHDLDVRRAHLKSRGVRLVEDLKVGDDALAAEALHLHPRDTGGCLLSIDRHGPDTGMMGSYRWAGADWRKAARRDVSINGATMQCEDAGNTAARWSDILGVTARAMSDGQFEIALDNARLRFGPLTDDRGEGLQALSLACANGASVLSSARAAHANTDAEGFEACGVRFDIAS